MSKKRSGLGVVPSIQCRVYPKPVVRLHELGKYHSRVRRTHHADCLRALSRILRRLLPTMSSSPGCMVMGRMRISSVVGRPTPKGAFGVLIRARTPLIFSLVCTSIRGSPAFSCSLH